MDMISPKYQMQLVNKINEALFDLFETSKYKNVELYIKKWHEVDYNYNNFPEENFEIVKKSDGNIDLLSTLHNIYGELLLKIAIDIGVETPDLIPSIPVFRNVIKAEFESASATFEKAFKQIEEHPDIAIGLANSALESILKAVLNDERIEIKDSSKKTLYDLTSEILKVFQLFPNSEMPKEIKTIGSSLLSINQSIEKLRSDKTILHGKTNDDYVVNDSLYTYFVVNSVATVGLFLDSYYKNKFPKEKAEEENIIETDDLPF